MNKQMESYIPSHYSQLSNTYNRNEFDSILKLLRHLAFHCNFSHKYPIFKLLKAVCRKLLINQFQSIFFAYVVQINKWNIQDRIILKQSNQVRDIVCFSTDDIQYKSIILYLLLCGYTVKYYLTNDIDIYVMQIQKICPNFRQIFQQWAKQYAQTTLKINPKNLNRVYKRIYLNLQQKNIHHDYNALVDNLLQISPAYNPEKLKSHENNKKMQNQLFKHSQKSKNTFINSILGNISLFSTSSMCITSNNINQNLEENNSNFPNNNNQFSLGSSIFGLDNTNAVQDLDVKEVTIGVGKVGESDFEQQQNIKKVVKKQEQKNEDQSEISFRRIASNTSEYIFRDS